MSGTVVFEDAKLQAVELIAETVTLNNFSVSTATTFQQTTNASNVTTNTLRFTNPKTAFVTTGNVEVGGELTVGSNVEVGGELTVGSNVEIGTANLFVDTTTGNVGVGTTGPKTLTHIGKLSTNSTTNETIPSAGMGVSTSFPGSTHLWLGNHSSAEAEDYWGMALGTLYASGNSYIQTLDKNNSSYYNLLLQPNGGNVGIGVTSPDAVLDVQGLKTKFKYEYRYQDLWTSNNNQTFTIPVTGGNARGLMLVEAKVIQVAANSSGARVARVKGMISNYHTGNYYMTVIEGENVSAFETYMVGTSGSAAGTFTMKYQPEAGYQQDVSCRLYLKIWYGGWTWSFGALSRTDTGSNTSLTVPTLDDAATSFGSNVGIGTSSPKAVAHVGKISANSGTFNDVPQSNMGLSATFPDSTRLWLGNRLSATGEDYWGMAMGVKYTGDMYIQSVNKNSTAIYDLLLQPNGGRVGVNTTDPQAKLHVDGDNFIPTSRSYFHTGQVTKNNGNTGAQTKNYFAVDIGNGYLQFQIELRGYCRNSQGNGNVDPFRRFYTIARNLNANASWAHTTGEDITASGWSFGVTRSGGSTSTQTIYFTVVMPNQADGATYMTIQATVLAQNGGIAHSARIP